MNVAGVLVHADPSHAPQVRERVEQLAGVEVHAISPAGQLVVTAERDDDAGMLATLEALRATPEVYSVTLVYHHSEPDDAQRIAKREQTP